ncbi:MAG: Murein DD-endopeptidase MepS/Murein LD-carboxypeptidase [Polaribacter sp. SA4-10]|nr:MAG: Murein DD-endopeptidase MepS/Murein LD-carboxypeptidase [Polaribacter sp. SA4-10]
MKLSKYLKIGFILLPICFIFYLFSGENIDKILSNKIKNNSDLIEKYKEFDLNNTAKEIEFKRDIKEDVILTAKSFLGTPNKIGGTDKDYIDASGLVFISIKNNSSTEFPRIAQEMARYGEIIIEPKDLKRGDLVFFFDTYEVDRIITSVGIYTGKGDFVTSTSSKGVIIKSIDDPYYWSQKFFYGTRIFN